MRAGTSLGPLTVGPVSPEKMKIYAAIVRDPNPIHWDRSELARRGLGDRLINQGPINLGYVVNMLTGVSAGPQAIKRLTVRFGENVREGDIVVARGLVRSVEGRLATCEVWLELPSGRRAVEGTAIIEI
jgi:acyl dehydratase